MNQVSCASPIRRRRERKCEKAKGIAPITDVYRSFVAATVIALFSLHCANTPPPPDNSLGVDGSVDAPRARDPDARGADASTSDRPLEPIAADPRCAQFDELAIDDNRVPAAPLLAFERADIVAGRNDSNELCPDSATAADGDDATVKFTAPRAGSWRLTARGQGLASMRVRRRCSLMNSCAQTTAPLAGPDLSTKLTRELYVQEGESIEVTLDGCPSGASCAFSLRAERWGPLACWYDVPGNRPCPAEHACSVDGPDSPRVTCTPTVDLRTAATVVVRDTEALVDPASNQMLFSAALDDGAVGSVTVRGERWLLASGGWVPASNRVDFVFSVLAENGSIEPTLVVLPIALSETPYVGLEVSMNFGRTTLRETLRFAPWRRPMFGEPCDPDDLRTRCASPTQCSRQNNRCENLTALDVHSFSAFASADDRSIGVRIRGVLPTRSGVLRIEAIGERGVWRSTDNGVLLSPRSFDNIEYDLQFTAALPEDRYSRARLVIEADGATSAPVAVDVQAPRVASIAEPCGTVDVRCASGLECNFRALPARCDRVARPDLCSLDSAQWASTWAPSGDTSAIRGAGSPASSDLAPQNACANSLRIEAQTHVVFVAPREGRYRFESQGVSELKTLAVCAQQECRGASGGDSVISVERTLLAGQRFLLSVSTLPRAGETSIRATRLEE